MNPAVTLKYRLCRSLLTKVSAN